MIVRSKKLVEFEKRFLKENTLDIKSKYRILNALYEEALHLGIIPQSNPLDGLKKDLRIARAINNV